MTAHPSDWRSAPARTKRLALAAVLGIAGGAVLTTLFSGALARATGPTLAARNDAGEILLANSTTLFRITADGASATTLPVAELRLHGPVTSVSSDGNDWFIGDDATGMLYRCDLSARHCVVALKMLEGKRIFRRAHAIAFAADRIFLTDSTDHRLVVFDRDGRLLERTRTAPLAFCFPNGVVVESGELYVADTNNFRIARIAIDDPARSATFFQVNAGAEPTRPNCKARSGAFGERGTPALDAAVDSSSTVARSARPPASEDRVWPTSLLHTSAGEWWVIQMDKRMRQGEVIRYDALGNPLARVALPEGADPIELIEAHDEVLITDAGLTRVHRATLDGKLVGDWGPPAFRDSLRGILAERDFNRSLKHISIGVIGAGVLAALFVVVWELRRQRAEGWSVHGTMAPVMIQPVALTTETLWTALDGVALRRLHRAGWVLAACVLSLFLIVGIRARGLSFDTVHARVREFQFHLVIGVATIVAIFVIVAIARAGRRRLGVSAHGVRFTSGSDPGISVPWDDVRVGPRSILLGRHLVQTIDAYGRYLFPQSWLEAELLSRVPRSAFMGHGRLMFEALRRKNVGMWCLVLALACNVAVILLRIYQPDVLRQWATWLYGWFR